MEEVIPTPSARQQRLSKMPLPCHHVRSLCCRINLPLLPCHHVRPLCRMLLLRRPYHHGQSLCHMPLLLPPCLHGQSPCRRLLRKMYLSLELQWLIYICLEVYQESLVVRAVFGGDLYLPCRLVKSHGPILQQARTRLRGHPDGARLPNNCRVEERTGRKSMRQSTRRCRLAVIALTLLDHNCGRVPRITVPDHH